jgi:hypothetical protein
MIATVNPAAVPALTVGGNPLCHHLLTRWRVRMAL